jgi:hypothetical protein
MFNKIVESTIEVTLIVFGPVLFVLTATALASLGQSNSSTLCDFGQFYNQINAVDSFVLCMIIAFSFIITFIYGLQKSTVYAEKEIQDE